MLRLLNNHIIILFLFSSLFASTIMDKCNLKIEEFFPNLISKKHDVYKLSQDDKHIENIIKQNFFRGELNVWEIRSADSSKHYAILDNVLGKTMPITFLTIFNNSGMIEDVSIIKYREPYGHEVKHKTWLSQFRSYNNKSNYIIGDGIDAISGATISVHSITKGINKLSYLINDIINGNLHTIFKD